MKCPFCGGSGVNETWVSTDKVSEYKQTCFKCHGKGEWDCTNEEFIRHCTTEELVKVIFNICYRATWDYNIKIMVGQKRKDLIEKWLKSEHKE